MPRLSQELASSGMTPFHSCFPARSPITWNLRGEGSSVSSPGPCRCGCCAVSCDTARVPPEWVPKWVFDTYDCAAVESTLVWALGFCFGKWVSYHPGNAAFSFPFPRSDGRGHELQGRRGPGVCFSRESHFRTLWPVLVPAIRTPLRLRRQWWKPRKSLNHRGKVAFPL